MHLASYMSNWQENESNLKCVCSLGRCAIPTLYYQISETAGARTAGTSCTSVSASCYKFVPSHYKTEKEDRKKQCKGQPHLSKGCFSAIFQKSPRWCLCCHVNGGIDLGIYTVRQNVKLKTIISTSNFLSKICNMQLSSFLWGSAEFCGQKKTFSHNGVASSLLPP